jgi:hypothetical protein
MNKRRIVLLLVLALTGCHHGNLAGANTDRCQDGLKNQVKTVRAESASFIQKDGAWVEQPRGLAAVTTYDADGHQSEESQLGANDALIFKVTCGQAERGRSLERTAMTPNGAPLEKTVMTYDGKGQLTETVVYKTGDTLHSKTIYTYGDNGKLVEWSRYNARGAIIDHWDYGYDGNGNRSEETRYFSDDSVDMKCVYTFDANGNPMAVAKYKADGTLSEKDQYAYEFDSAGNWTKKTTSRWLLGTADSEFQPVEVTHRTIAYF